MNLIKIMLQGPLQNLITKIIMKIIFEKFGYKINIVINEIEVSEKDEKVCLHLNCDGTMLSKDFYDLLSNNILK